MCCLTLPGGTSPQGGHSSDVFHLEEHHSEAEWSSYVPGSKQCTRMTETRTSLYFGFLCSGLVEIFHPHMYWIIISSGCWAGKVCDTLTYCIRHWNLKPHRSTKSLQTPQAAGIRYDLHRQTGWQELSLQSDSVHLANLTSPCILQAAWKRSSTTAKINPEGKSCLSVTNCIMLKVVTQ